MGNFEGFKLAVQKQFEKLSKGGLYTADIDKELASL